MQLATGQSVRVNVALEVGQITETTEISAGATVLQTESAEVNQAFEQKRIAELPINADNIFNWINNWTKVAGSHTFKWGADIRRLCMDRLQIQGIGAFGPRNGAIDGCSQIFFAVAVPGPEDVISPRSVKERRMKTIVRRGLLG